MTKSRTLGGLRVRSARSVYVWGVLLCLLPARTFSLTIEEAVDAAQRTNERARAADETARAAEARVAKARSFFFPDVTVLGDYTRRSDDTKRTVDGRTTTIQSRNALEGRITVTQTLFDAQAFPLLKQASRARDAARFDALDARRRLGYESAQAYLAVLNVEQITRAATQRLELAQRNLEEIRVRFGAQLVGSNDVTRAELEVATAEREQVRARGAERTARLELGYLLGSPIETPLESPARLLESAKRPILADEPSELPANGSRHDLHAEQARVRALRSGASEPSMRYLPDLELSGTTWTTNETGFSERDQDWSVGVGLEWDLFDGGEREADRSALRAVARAAELELERLERRVDVDVEAARVALESEQASLARADVAVVAARRNADETTELYRQGLARALEVVDANVQLFEAQVERAGAEAALALSYLGWRAAVGLDPFDPESHP